MTRNILILGASYGSLLATKLLMAGHNVTLVCRKQTAELINRDGTEVRIKLRDETAHRPIFSRDLPGVLDAVEPADVVPSRYDLVALAMQEPQYAAPAMRLLMIKIAEAKLPCLSIMNMPPLPYLKRIPALSEMELEKAYTNAAVGTGSSRAWCRSAPRIRRPSVHRKSRRMFFTSACRPTSRPRHLQMRNIICCCGSWKPTSMR